MTPHSNLTLQGILRKRILLGAWLLIVGCSTTKGTEGGGVGGTPSLGGAGGSLGGSGGSGASSHAGGSVASSGGAGGAGASVASGGAVGSGSAASSGGAPVGSGGAEAPGSGGTTNDALAALIASLDAYWDFESASGSSVPSVVGEAELELTGAAVAPGPTGNQLTLAGLASGAESTAPILDTAGSFSIASWVKLDELEQYNTFVSLDGSEVSAVYLQKRSDHRLALTTFPEDSAGASPCITTAEIQPRAAEWYHVVGTRDAETRTQRLYIDGVLSGKTTCPAGVFSAGGPLRVGSGQWDAEQGDFVSGAIDGLAIARRVLTPRDALDFYRGGRPEARNYLFSYFVEVTQGRGDGLRLAHSHDGLHWGAIGAGKVFMPPSVGGGSFRDPHVMRHPDGTYHLVWTTSCVPWAEQNCVEDRGFAHATSRDLVTWSAADYIVIDLNVEHVWAPETSFDPATNQYMVVFSSPIDNNPSAADPHSLYSILTSDFESHSPPQVLYSQPGRNFIDGTILRQGDEFLMILKDEADGQKNLRALLSPSLFGENAWQGSPSAPLTGNYAAEGPSLLERDGQLLIYFDKYGEGAYGALRATQSADLTLPSTWQDLSASVFFPGVRHGTPIEVPWDVFEKVALAAGQD